MCVEERCIRGPEPCEPDSELLCVVCGEPGGELEFVTRRYFRDTDVHTGQMFWAQIHRRCLQVNPKPSPSPLQEAADSDG